MVCHGRNSAQYWISSKWVPLNSYACVLTPQSANADIWRATPQSLDLRSSLTALPDSLHSNTTLLLRDPSLTSESPTVQHSDYNAKRWDLTTLLSTFHDAYHPLSDMYTFADMLVGHFNDVPIDDGVLSVEGFDVGQTWEGRPIRAWRASIARDGLRGGRRKGRVEPEEEPRFEFLVQSGSHAREVSYVCSSFPRPGGEMSTVQAGEGWVRSGADLAVGGPGYRSLLSSFIAGRCCGWQRRGQIVIEGIHLYCGPDYQP